MGGVENGRIEIWEAESGRQKYGWSENGKGNVWVAD